MSELAAVFATVIRPFRAALRAALDLPNQLSVASTFSPAVGGSFQSSIEPTSQRTNCAAPLAAIFNAEHAAVRTAELHTDVASDCAAVCTSLPCPFAGAVAVAQCSPK